MLRQITTVKIVLVFSGLLLVVLWVFYVNLRLRDSYETQARAAQNRADLDNLTNDVKTLRDISEARLSVLERDVFGATSAPIPPKVIQQTAPDWQRNSLNDMRRRVTVLEEWRVRHGIQ